jgi:hypothetical protein
MAEVRSLSNNIVTSDSFQPHDQYGLFATTAYREGDVILVESPLLVLSASSAASDANAANNTSTMTAAASTSDTLSTSERVPVPSCRSQFAPTSLTSTTTIKDSLTLNDLVLPPSVQKQLHSKSNSKDTIIDESRINKIRGMILALAAYAMHPPSEETLSKLLELYHPSISCTNNDEKQHGRDDEEDAIELAKLAVKCCESMCTPNSALGNLLKNDTTKENMIKILLIYSCNAFEGGRIYHRLSRVNHSCNPNAVVLEGYSSSSSSNNTETKQQDVSILKAACDIAPGEEITISYLGKYLFAGYSIRQRILRANKHFVCGCSRCSIAVADNAIDGINGDRSDGQCSTTKISSGDDVASCIPCPTCHPRSGRYLDDDVMLDEDGDEENGFKVCYAIPRNGLTPTERSMYCSSCKGTIRVILDGDGGSMRKKKEGNAIKYMCMAEEKVYERLESIGKMNGGGGDNDTESEQDMDRQFLQMATSICGSRHWTTHFMNLHVMEESLASIHTTMMSNAKKDAEMIEDMYVEIAEAADGLDKAYKFATSLGLKLHPAHWLFDYTIALAQTLVGLGDEKSQQYGSTWIEKVEGYAERFENERMQEVVVALRDAWKKGSEGKGTENGSKREVEDVNEDTKRRKLG